MSSPTSSRPASLPYEASQVLHSCLTARERVRGGRAGCRCRGVLHGPTQPRPGDSWQLDSARFGASEPGACVAPSRALRPGSASRPAEPRPPWGAEGPTSRRRRPRWVGARLPQDPSVGRLPRATALPACQPVPRIEIDERQLPKLNVEGSSPFARSNARREREMLTRQGACRTCSVGWRAVRRAMATGQSPAGSSSGPRKRRSRERALLLNPRATNRQAPQLVRRSP